MAAQPAPSQTPTNTTPTPSRTGTAAQARDLLQVCAVLQRLLSTIPNPPASRNTPNATTPNPAPTVTAAQIRAVLQRLLSSYPFPTLTAAQARAVLQACAVLQMFLSNIPNPPAPRTPPNTTTPNNAPTPPSKNQPLSPYPTIIMDPSTRINGHENQIHSPPHNVHEAHRVEQVMRAALPHTKSTSNQAARPVNIEIHTGVKLIGSRNSVVFGYRSHVDDGAASKDLGKARGGMETVVAGRVCEEGAAGRKRRAVSEPVGEAQGKKVKV